MVEHLDPYPTRLTEYRAPLPCRTSGAWRNRPQGGRLTTSYPKPRSPP